MPVEVLSTIKRIFSAPIEGAFALALMMGGCSVEPAGNTNPADSNSALYGLAQGTPSKFIPRAGAGGNTEDWTRASFACVQTELSPATLYHSTSKYLGLFTHLSDHGLGAPSFAAFDTPTGPKISKNGEPMEVKWMEENWVLVWFAGARGWTNWDTPWVVYLQHKPTTMKLDEAGLHFEFKEAAGDVVLLPLYGYDKGSPRGKDFLVAHGLPSNKIQTWQWLTAIPREPLMRVKYWACATREFPIYCEDSFSVNRAKNTVTIRQRFQWHSIVDDWDTRHIKQAPISPPLALASRGKQFPVEFSKPVMDFALATPYGPYMAVENVESFDATFKVLQYVNEKEAYDPPQTTNHPTVLAALERLRQTAKETFGQPVTEDHDSNGLGAVTSNLWYAKGLPYYDEATRTNALARLRKFFHEEVLGTKHFESRGAEKLDAALLEAFWAYAHFTGDWDLVHERWDLIKKLFRTPAETRWVGFAGDAIAELGEEAAPCVALARMAYKAGDMDTYNYACYMFARELVHHYIQQSGAPYFRDHQPWHSLEFIEKDVYLTSLGGAVEGWRINGPKYPVREAGERQYSSRWMRFGNEDVARFYRDYLKEDVRRELDLLAQQWGPERKYTSDPKGLPSEVQLRTLLLNETPAQLAGLATPEQFSGPPAGVIASCISVLRASHPTRFERLIPAGEPSPFVVGLEREVAGPNPYLGQAIQWRPEDKPLETNQPTWPEVTWWKSWSTPTGHRWTFGQVTPLREGPPSEARAVRLNWNTVAIVYAVKKKD